MNASFLEASNDEMFEMDNAMLRLHQIEHYIHFSDRDFSKNYFSLKLSSEILFPAHCYSFEATLIFSLMQINFLRREPISHYTIRDHYLISLPSAATSSNTQRNSVHNSPI